MMEIRHVANYGVEVADLVRETFAIIAERPGIGMQLLDLVELASIDIAEAGPLDHGMSSQAGALEIADTADADLENPQFTILIGLAAGGQGKRCHAGCKNGAVAEERSASDG